MVEGSKSPFISSPEMIRPSSCWPFPDTPAIPTISPPNTDILKSFRSAPNGSGFLIFKLVIFKIGFLDLLSLFRRSIFGIVRPIISVANSCALVLLGSTLPVTLPSLKIVATSHSSRISSNL